MGCSTPVAVVVEYSSSPTAVHGEGNTGCGINYNYLKHAQYDESKALPFGGLEAVENAKTYVKEAVKCCTHNGGEHVGWKKSPGGKTYAFPVCLYR